MVWPLCMKKGSTCSISLTQFSLSGYIYIKISKSWNAVGDVSFDLQYINNNNKCLSHMPWIGVTRSQTFKHDPFVLHWVFTVPWFDNSGIIDTLDWRDLTKNLRDYLRARFRDIVPPNFSNVSLKSCKWDILSHWNIKVFNVFYYECFKIC